MKATRFLLVLAMTSTACLPGSGVSPGQAVVANPDPQLVGPGTTSPVSVRQAPERSTSQPVPAMSSKKKTVLIVVGVVAVAALVIVLASGGSGYGGGY